MLELRIKKPIPFPISAEEIYELGKRLPTDEQRALFYTTYLTGGRISEVLQIQKRDVWREKVQYNNMEYDAVIFEMVTNKIRTFNPRRLIPVPCVGVDGDMAEVVWQYRNTKTRDEEKLFHFSRTRAWNIFAKLTTDTRAINPDRTYSELLGFKIHPHYLRHCRATHLVVKYRVNNPYDLMKRFGWSDVRRAMTYLQLDWYDLLKGMLSGEGSK